MRLTFIFVFSNNSSIPYVSSIEMQRRNSCSSSLLLLRHPIVFFTKLVAVWRIGRVYSPDVKSGLSILCGGDMHDKAESTFALYDLNGDGFISKDEMVSYLSNVFRVPWSIVHIVQDTRTTTQRYIHDAHQVP